MEVREQAWQMSGGGGSQEHNPGRGNSKCRKGMVAMIQDGNWTDGTIQASLVMRVHLENSNWEKKDQIITLWRRPYPLL